MSTLGWAGLVAACGAGAAAAVEAVRRVAVHRSVLDVPNERSSHNRPIPRGGGLGMVAAVAVTWPVGARYVRSDHVVSIAVGAALVAGVSALDDVRTVRSGPRLAVHVVAAALVVWETGGWSSAWLPGGGTIELGVVGAVLAILWTVGLTNAFNFMDGIDAMAGGQAVVAGSTWAIAGWISDVPAGALLAALVAAAAAGFLVHNVPPARVFMGDVGSTTTGFIFATVPLQVAAGADPVDAARLPLLAVLAVWPFVYDTATTFARRLARREDVMMAHRSHLYQRLVIAGAGHGPTSLLYAGLALASSAAGLVWLANGGWAPAMIALIAVPVVLETKVRRVERRHR